MMDNLDWLKDYLTVAPHGGKTIAEKVEDLTRDYKYGRMDKDTYLEELASMVREEEGKK